MTNAVVSRLVVAGLAAFGLLLLAGRAIAGTQVLVPPVSPACISSPFGPRILPDHPQAGTYHYGIDLPAPDGAPVVATAPGTVMRIDEGGPGGLEVVVQHKGFIGVYSHFQTISPVLVEGKTHVAAGENLGVVGKSGMIFGTHLYFEMILGGKPVDPAPYLGVPMCSGEPHRTASARTGSKGVEGVMVDGRRYYMLLPSAGR
ncbi:MAG TPA: M23 family metallopeptidase [Acetobacteraceae bacterium]|jgi:murein DD-endopeptidase MepM/ murein hydrolase activator NlpD|nr:M23 family metallopeptidase [Acetobacteraceae bacterium]